MFRFLSASSVLFAIGPLALTPVFAAEPANEKSMNPIPAGLPRLAAAVEREGKTVLVSIDPASLKERPLFDDAVAAYGPALSRDGKWLAFVAETREIRVASLIMGDAGKVSHTMIRGQGAAWSPDGERIAYNPVGSEDIFVMDRDGSNVRNLTNSKRRMNTEPAWSPDGKQIAFVAVPEKEHHFRMYVMNADGSDQRLLCPQQLGGNVFPDWSGDGKRIVLSSYSREDASNRLSILDVATGALSPVTKAPGFQVFPRWSPDGRTIAYANFPEQPGDASLGDLMIVDAATGEQWTLLKGQVPRLGGRPCWLSVGAQRAGR